jgi:hypothetical protein
MSGVMKSIPATSRPDDLRGLFGDLDVLLMGLERRSIEMPPVDMFPVSTSFTTVFLDGTSAELEPLRPHQRDRELVHLDAREDFLVADAAARVGVGRLDQLGDGVLPVAGHVRRTRSATATMRPPTTSTR